MSQFLNFKEAVHAKFEELSARYNLFTTQVPKDDVWDMYLASFPEGTNPIYRERTEHDCQCCKQFIRHGGNVVAIDKDLGMISIWDVDVPEPYQTVAKALSAYVKSQPIDNIYRHFEKNLGVDHNFDTHHAGRWDHFHFALPAKFVAKATRDRDLGYARASYDVFRRSMKELTLESAQIVKELIDQNSLYRGEEHLKTVKQFMQMKKQYDSIDSNTSKDLFLWGNVAHLGPQVRFRNTVIGTLLDDISTGVELDKAVKSFEDKVAPANYKRTSAIVTPGMINKAEEKLTELGLHDALQRRYATIDDITVNNLLFVNRSTKKAMGVFDEMRNEAPIDAKKFSKVEEVNIDDFVERILPNATSVSVLLENNHANNLVSLIAPSNDEAPNILKWDNNFSWSYNGEVTDSIKEKVKAAGGDVTGALRCSLAWFNHDDLDIHLKTPSGEHIYYRNKEGRRSKAVLDVDMNAGGRISDAPVENITWRSKDGIEPGTYRLYVNNYMKRAHDNEGFELEIEYEGKIEKFVYDRPVRGEQNIDVATFDFDPSTGLTVHGKIDSSTSSKSVWGVSTHRMLPVNAVMLSPNHWDDMDQGNKHWFFMLEGCNNPEPARGLYNEFLRPELTEHRKVFEVLGTKLKAPTSEHQLSGIGFSSTQRNSVLCQVAGAVNRTIRINF